MKRTLLTHAELIQLFTAAQERPATPLLAMLGQHLEDKDAINASASVARGLQQSQTREPLLCPPQEILPPLA